MQPLAVDRRLAESGAKRVVVRAQAVEQRSEVVEMGEVADADRAAADLVLIGGADAAAGRADLAGAARRPRAARRGRGGSAGSAGRSRRSCSTSGVTSTPCSRIRSTSALSAHGSSTTPLPMTDGVPRTMPARKQRELVGLVADDERVAGVVAALEAHDHVGAARQPVDDLALAFVAPLGADDGDVSHVVPCCCAARAALGAEGVARPARRIR